MANKIVETDDTYVVYHIGKDETDQRPCYFKSPEWKDKCTTDFSNAYVTNDPMTADNVARSLNDQAAKAGHCLAGHIKFGKVCIREIKPASF